MHADLFHQLALTLVPRIGCVQAKILVNHFGTAGSVFSAKKTELEKMDGIGTIRARYIKSFADFSRVEKELRFIEKYSIRALFISDKDYPQRLLHCYDSPVLLYYRGNADLNASRIISVIGTRSHSEYGKQQTEKIIGDLSGLQVLVVSGLAFGVDIIAHRAALKNGLSTVAVLAHGLDKLYPPEHASIAKEMLQQGGLLTEFMSHTKPDKHHFPVRNRIVAGMTDATLVIETGIRGGSMITAELANGYNRDVFAIPGKLTDSRSSGCNHLIKANKAVLLTDAQQLIDNMGWEEKPREKIKKQKELFIQLTEDERKIVDIISKHSPVHIDEIHIKSGLSSSMVAKAILNLEMENIILSLPGKRYTMT